MNFGIKKCFQNPVLYLFAFILVFGACNPETENGLESGSEDTLSNMVKDNNSETDSFADFGNDEEFRDAHPEPAAITIADGKGGIINLKVEDGKPARAYLVKPGKTSDKYLLLFHEWWGLNDHIKREAQHYSEVLGVNVLAPDLYDGKTTTSSEEASKLMKEANEDRIQDIIESAIKFTGNEAPIGTIGWCFGGGWSLRAAIMAEERGTACVVFYGMPVTDKEKLRDLNASVLGIFAKQDKWITPKKVSEFKDAMQEMGKDLSVQTYDADHAFANPSGKSYKEKSAREATALSEQFLKEYLK